MATETDLVKDLANKEYKYGFTSNIEQEYAEKGLNEDIVRFISMKKEEPEFMLEWRLKAFRFWQKMKMPTESTKKEEGKRAEHSSQAAARRKRILIRKFGGNPLRVRGKVF